MEASPSLRVANGTQSHDQGVAPRSQLREFLLQPVQPIGGS